VTLGSAAIAAGQGKEAERLAKEVPNEVLGTPEKGIPPDHDGNTRIYGRKSDPKDILFKVVGVPAAPRLLVAAPAKYSPHAGEKFVE
jgi:hypothetical protein